MLYRVLKRLIENKQVDGMTEKLDIFYAANKLTKEEYEELVSLLSAA